MFFDDWLGSEDINLCVSEGLLSRQEATDLQPFSSALATYLDKWKKNQIPDSEIIKDPEWKKVSRIAAETYNKLSARLRS
jgi:hypothetical protein